MKEPMAAMTFPMQAAEGDRTLELQTLENFLISIERRAFLMARTRLGNDEDALDVVQDAMAKLVQRYGNKSPDDWRPLFYSILNSRITDVYRRQAVRNRFKGWLGGTADSHGEADEPDPFQQVPGPDSDDPSNQLERQQQAKHLLAALAELPQRQQQAFMLRCWEGLSTAETSVAMKCTEGSVKTHYFRALHALREKLEDYRL